MINLLEITWTGELGVFSLGPLTLRLYSLMFVAAFLCGWYIMNHVYKEEKADLNKLDALFMYTFIGTIFGARLGHVVFYQPELFSEDFINVFMPFSLQGGFHFTGFRGLASHGAAIAIPITTYLYSRIEYKVPFLWVADRLVITIALAGFFIRMGNFFNSEIVGKPSYLPWAVKFVNQSTAYGDIVPRHPTQLYEAFSYLFLFFIIWWIYKKTEKKYYLGWFLGFFTFFLWLIRFFIEFLKEPQSEDEPIAKFFDMGINNGQLLSIPLIIIGLILLITSKNRYYVLGK